MNKNFHLLFAIINALFLMWNLDSFISSNSYISLILAIIMAYFCWVEVERFVSYHDSKK